MADLNDLIIGGFDAWPLAHDLFDLGAVPTCCNEGKVVLAQILSGEAPREPSRSVKNHRPLLVHRFLLPMREIYLAEIGSVICKALVAESA